MPKHKYIQSPAKMWEYFKAYVDEVAMNPFQKVEQKKGNIVIPRDYKGSLVDLTTVTLPVQRPLTMEGFENYLFINGVITDVSDYFENKQGRYAEYIPISRAIRRMIRQNQMEGGMAGLFNHSLTARICSLADKSEINFSTLPDEDLDRFIDALIEKNNQNKND